MDLVFASDSIWNWEAEKNFAKLKAENPDLIQTGNRTNGVVVAEKGVLHTRRESGASLTSPSWKMPDDSYRGYVLRGYGSEWFHSSP